MTRLASPLPSLRPPDGLLHLAELEHHGRETSRVGLGPVPRSDPALGVLVALSIIPVADHPDRRDRLIRVDGEDDPPAPVTDYDLAPASEASAKGEAGVLPDLLQPEQLL